MPYISTAERIGFEQGLEQGLEQGCASMSEALLQLWHLKFGAVSVEHEQKLAEADLRQLDTWLTKSVQADSLAAIFD